MAAGEALPVAVQLDEIALSLLGWELVDLRARVAVSPLGSTTYTNLLAAAGELRFHPDDWRDRFDDEDMSPSDYLPPILWQLRSAQHGPLMSYQQLLHRPKVKEMRAPKAISSSTQQWLSRSAPDPDDLSLWVTAVDWEEIDGWRSEPSVQWAGLPVELVDQTTLCGIQTNVRELTARIRDDEEVEVSLWAQFTLGTAEQLLADAIGSDEFHGDPHAPVGKQEDYKVQTPDVTIDLYDETGFLLNSRTLSNYRWVGVKEGGIVPRRSPTMAAVAGTRLNDLIAAPHRVVVRLTDPTG